MLAQFSENLYITEEVDQEFIKDRQLLDQVLTAGMAQVKKLELAYFPLFNRLIQTQNLGTGEASSIAFAILNNYDFATNDRLAIKKFEEFRPEYSSTCNAITPEIIVKFFEISQTINPAEANRLREIFIL